MDSLTDSKKAWRCAWPCLASVERFNSFVYDHSENHATAFLTWTRRQLFGTSSASYRPLARNFDSFLYSPIVTIQRQDCTDDWNVSAVYSAVVHWLNRDSTQIVSLITHLSDIAYLVSRHIFEYYIFCLYLKVFNVQPLPAERGSFLSHIISTPTRGIVIWKFCPSVRPPLCLSVGTEFVEIDR